MACLPIQIGNIPGTLLEALYLDVLSQKIGLSKLPSLSISRTAEKMQLKEKTGG
jgi:hypothetical protein